LPGNKCNVSKNGLVKYKLVSVDSVTFQYDLLLEFERKKKIYKVISPLYNNDKNNRDCTTLILGKCYKLHLDIGGAISLDTVGGSLPIFIGRGFWNDKTNNGIRPNEDSYVCIQLNGLRYCRKGKKG